MVKQPLWHFQSDYIGIHPWCCHHKWTALILKNILLVFSAISANKHKGSVQLGFFLVFFKAAKINACDPK